VVGLESLPLAPYTRPATYSHLEVFRRLVLGINIITISLALML